MNSSDIDKEQYINTKISQVTTQNIEICSSRLVVVITGHLMGKETRGGNYTNNTNNILIHNTESLESVFICITVVTYHISY